MMRLAMTSLPLPPKSAPVLGLILSLFISSSRFYTSAAYERPIHFGIITLIATAISLAVSKRLLSRNHSSQYTLTTSADPETGLFVSRGQLDERGFVQKVKNCIVQTASLPRSFFLLIGCIVIRIHLFWLVVRTTQCSTLGVEAFLPLLVLLCDKYCSSTARVIPTSSDKTTSVCSVSRRHRFEWAYGCIALLWGFAAISALDQFRTATGTACPPSWDWRPLILSAQILACFIDAVLLINIHKLCETEVDEVLDASKSSFLIIVLLVSAFVAFLVTLPRLVYDSNLFWSFLLPWQDVKDLAIDSLLATTAILCGHSFLHLIHPTTMALAISTVYLFGYHIPTIGVGTLLNPSSSQGPLRSHLLAVTVIGILCCLTLRPAKNRQPSTSRFIHHFLAVCLGVGCMLPLFTSSILSDANGLSLREAVDELTTAAHIKFKYWAEQAATSQTLEEAVAEYMARYGLPPPPNFDKWYTFAVENSSPIIDDFEQIHQDLLPFWGIEPATIRQRTAHLLDYSNLEMGGIRIRNGTLEQSPHISGSHRWMMDSMQRMIEPFVQWLPDMDIAFNLADECRMAIPFEEMQSHRRAARKVMRNMMRPGQKLESSTMRALNGSQWPPSFRTPYTPEHESPHFSNNIRWQLYYDLIAPSCPPRSPARTTRWWDRSTMCVECILPHSTMTDDGALIADARLANNLCHQPDMAYLHGFIMSPSAMVGTSMLFPIFSQGRMGGFSDIMIPSPWNFDEKSHYNESYDDDWEAKSNSLFWRGSASDGYAAHGSWTGFLRTRFVHEAYQKRLQLADNQTNSYANVSFAGTMSKCHDADCVAELHAFHSWANDIEATGPCEGKDGSNSTCSGDRQSLLSHFTPFEEHWQFRHLIDLDGAGFSGRFLPFLKSKSLVYRAALFQAWFDERLNAWYHYVPVDVRLGSSFWALFDFFSSRRKLKRGAAHDYARDIADQGRDWAQKALRTEDMRIYMFRLLLEWGRLVDDNREHLGFEG